MPTAEEIKSKVEEYSALTKQIAEIKSKVDRLKVYFENIAVNQLKDTKLKTISYWSENTKVTVGSSGTVKPISMQLIKRLFGEVFPDLVKEEVNYKMTEPCKRLLAAIWLGEYTEESMLNVINQITNDENTRKTLKKKLKGKYEKDKETLIKLLGYDEQEASDWAYLITEVENYETFCQLLKAAKFDGTVDAAIEVIRTAVIVDESLKVGIEAE